MSLVGLPETAVKESRDRVKAALETSGFEVPQRLVTISLAPAELPKEGGGFDLPIALGILVAPRGSSSRATSRPPSSSASCPWAAICDRCGGCCQPPSGQPPPAGRWWFRK